MNTTYVPVLTSQSGLCLTMENWQEIGISTAAYYLESLIMKPGYPLLKSLDSLQSYCGWPGAIVINASFAAANSEGIYNFRSLYDGSRLTISQDELFSLIIKLKPNMVILPLGFANYLRNQQLSFPQTLTPFIPENENAELDNGGLYFSYEKTESFASFLEKLKLVKNKSCYLSGHFDLMQAHELIALGVKWLESDKPSADALMGIIYGETNNFSLLARDMANQHQPIISYCTCPTCSQKLTRAYLHHLFQQTPLLCQRFLIQHNAHFFKTQLESMLQNSKSDELY